MSKQELSFGHIPVGVLPVVWPEVAVLLGGAVDTAKGKLELDDVRIMIENEDILLWLVVDGVKPIAAITTRIIPYPRRRAMALDWIGGTRMKEWLPLVQKTIEAFAVDNGCSHLEGYGRRAWGRWLEKHNWKPEYIAYRMELVDGQQGQH